MNEQQTFQKPWQMTLLQIHMVLRWMVHKVTDPIARLFDSNTKAFVAAGQKEERKHLKVVT